MNTNEIKESDAITLVRRKYKIEEILPILKEELDKIVAETYIQNHYIKENEDKMMDLEDEIEHLKKEKKVIDKKLDTFDHIPKGLADDETLDMFENDKRV